jgi:hypothetical protein
MIGQQQFAWDVQWLKHGNEWISVCLYDNKEAADEHAAAYTERGEHVIVLCRMLFGRWDGTDIYLFDTEPHRKPGFMLPDNDAPYDPKDNL